MGNHLPLRPGYEAFTPVHDTAFYYPDKPEVIIREYDYELGTLEEATTRIGRLRSASLALQEAGVAVVPHSHFVAGPGNRIYMVCDYVQGSVYKDTDFDSMPSHHQQMARELLKAQTNYLRESIDKGTERLSDILSLHQQMFTDTDCLLVDIGGPLFPGRNSTTYSIYYDMFHISVLAKTGMDMFANRPEEKAEFVDTVKALVQLCCQREGITVEDDDPDMFMSDIEDDEDYESDVFVSELINRPENSFYKDRQLAKRNLLKQKLATN